MHAYVHQIDFFLAQMGPNHTDFWGTVFVNPRYENDTELDAFRERVPLVDCAAKQLESHSVSYRDYSYLCVGPFLRSFGESFPGSSELSPGWLKLLKGRNTTEVVGALVHQADFWFHSSFGRGWPLENSIWHMDFACPQLNGIHALPPWGWRNEFKDGLEKRRQKIQSVLELDNLGTCFGSADLYYVSRAGWEMLGNITEIWQWNLKEDFKPRRDALRWWEGEGDTRRMRGPRGYNSNEVAVPITMDALQRKGLSTVEICWHDNKNGLGVERGRSESDLNKNQLHRDMCCATNSPRPYAWPRTISRNRCGHKMDMQDACSKEAYMQAWLSHEEFLFR